MKSVASTPQEYLNEIAEDRKEHVNRLREVIIKNLPKGFIERMSYGMIGYLVPFSIYPPGYHCAPKQELPFISLASQKNFIALHHMGLYAEKDLLDWFISEYPRYSKAKLDIGKGCIRFKNLANIPYELIGELVKKMTPQQWIESYERNFKKK